MHKGHETAAYREMCQYYLVMCYVASDCAGYSIALILPGKRKIGDLCYILNQRYNKFMFLFN